MVITKIEFTKAMKEINEAFLATTNTVKALEVRVAELEKKPVVKSTTKKA